MTKADAIDKPQLVSYLIHELDHYNTQCPVVSGTAADHIREALINEVQNILGEVQSGRFDVEKVDEDYDPRFKKLTDSLAFLLTAKNRQYGDSFTDTVKRYGKIAALTRMSDKFRRIEEIILNGTPGESLEDGVQDLAGYCILLLSVLHDDQVDFPQ